MTESKICTCPSGDGSLRWPCPKHPAVEQAGGDERAACNLWIAEQQLCQGSDISLFKLERNGALVSLRDLLRDAYQAGQARAALAQPSPVRSSLLINGYQLRAALDFIAPDGTAEQLESETCIEWRQQDADFLEAGLYAFCAEYPEEGGVLLDEEPTTAQPSPLQSEQAEAERPEVVAYLFVKPDGTLSMDAVRHKPSQPAVAVMTVAQHDRIVGALRAKADQLREALEWRKENQAGQRELLRSVTAERDAALARVVDLERQEPVVRAYGALPPFAEKVLAKLRRFYDCAEDFESGGVDIGRHWLDLLTQLGLLNRVQRSPALWEISQQGEDLLEAPVAQAQHSVPGDIMRDAQRYRWLRDQQFYFSFSTENSDAGISSCTAGMSSRFKNLSWVDAAIDSAIAAAPGKEGV
ncbi:hypothetical protein DB388_14125 [Pseudomonas aeruginosa]|uniref:hypothetical protein n=1 Tax=Pseudomonas aeruginosa TaxID=287 RepID=UPI000D378748|nr:hypothetical protein [Pseudomonas aeruginosa]PTZ26019.1 hypothetical protein DB388_14125 [Pseudomonas aeruginosa]